MWKQVFRGDSCGARCLKPPYVLSESTDDVVMEIQLPFWIDTEDCKVDITKEGITIDVRNQLNIKRTFWRNESEAKKKSNYEGPVLPEQCVWSLDDETNDEGERVKMLMITLVKPELTEDEIMWKKGNRMDNMNVDRRDGRNRKGYRFFIDDEDFFNLEGILQAMCFLESGEAWVPAKPYEHYHYPFVQSKLATKLDMLSEEASKHIESMLQDNEDDGSDDDDDDSEEDSNGSDSDE